MYSFLAWSFLLMKACTKPSSVPAYFFPINSTLSSLKGTIGFSQIITIHNEIISPGLRIPAKNLKGLLSHFETMPCSDVAITTLQLKQ
jgi:hypothetical protein